MVTIAVVDDELLAVRVVEKLLSDYTKVPLRLITALSGKEALDKLRGESVDIMLVDIEMRGMDGFSFIEEVRQKYQRMIPAIMITAYSQFDYCKMAFGARVSDYILKPLKKEELHEALDLVIDELSAQPTLPPSSQDQTAQVLATWVQQGMKAEELQAIEPQLVESLTHPMYCCAVLRTGSEQGFVHVEDELRKWRTHFEAPFLVVPMHSNREMLLLISMNKTGEQERFIQFVNQRKDRLPEPISLGISDLFQKIADLRTQIEGALNLARNQLISNGTRSLEVWRVNDCVEKEENASKHIREAINKWIAGLAVGSEEVAWKVDRSLFMSPSIDYQFFIDHLYYYLLRLQQLAHQYRVDVSPLINIEPILAQASHVAEVLDWVDVQSREVKEAIVANYSSTAYQNVVRVRKYIDEHYNEALTLDDVSAMAAVHTAYFCELFKKITGKTYISYVTELRVEKAKQLIDEQKVSIAELAEHVGYEDPNYFRRVFRKWTGMSPRQFEKRVR